jgi:hypothetical protein
MKNDAAAGTGYTFVDSEVICVLTRFRMRSLWSLPMFYLHYRRMRRELTDHRIHGLLKSAFLIEDPWTFYTLSLWSGAEAVGEFNVHVSAHTNGANAAIPRLWRDAGGRPQLWSVQWRLDAVSPHNLRWEGLQLDGTFRVRARYEPEPQVGLSHAS